MDAKQTEEDGSKLEGCDVGAELATMGGLSGSGFVNYKSSGSNDGAPLREGASAIS